MSEEFPGPKIERDRPTLEAGPGRLLALGRFAEVRNNIGHRGAEDEINYVWNGLWAMHLEYQTDANELYPKRPEMDALARDFFDSFQGTLDYYRSLFRLFQAMGFGEDARPAIASYVKELRHDWSQNVMRESGLRVKEEHYPELENIERAERAFEEVFGPSPDMPEDSAN